MTLLQLPVELLLYILQNVCKSELPSFALSSRSLGLLATEVLYEDIVLRTPHSAQRCCETISCAEFPCRIGSLVRSLTILPEVHRTYGKEDPGPKLSPLLFHALVRMDGLQHYCCMIPGTLTPDICFALTEKKTLRYLEVNLAANPIISPDGLLAGIQSRRGTAAFDTSINHTGKSTIEIVHLWDGISPWTSHQFSFLRYALNGKNLKELHIESTREIFVAHLANRTSDILSLLPGDGPLETITNAALSSINSKTLCILRRMTNLRSLTLDVTRHGDLDISATDLSEPIQVSGLCSRSNLDLLASLLQIFTGIRYLRLDGASHRPGDLSSLPLPLWSAYRFRAVQVLDIVSKFANSLQFLALVVDVPHHLAFMDECPSFDALQTLVIRITDYSCTVSVSRILSPSYV